METNTREKSWENCRYAVAADGGDEMAYELRNHGFFEIYSCENPNIINSGKFPIIHILNDDNSLSKLAGFCRVIIGGELNENEAKSLEERIQQCLEGCKHCKFYESKSTEGLETPPYVGDLF